MLRLAGFAWFVLALSLSACCCPCNLGPLNRPPARQPDAKAEPVAKTPAAPVDPQKNKDADNNPVDLPIDAEPRLALQLHPQRMSFGLTVLKDAANRPVNKRLTYSFDGRTNHTMVRIDGADFEFAGPGGMLLERDVRAGNRSTTSWRVRGVQVSQILEIVPSKQAVEVAPGVHKRVLDTCLIRYEIDNKDNKDHTVGLRVLVDTLIGMNDGVPFAVPTLQGLVTTFKDFPTPDAVPEFIQALEIPNLAKPGTIGHMTLKVAGGVEAPSRICLTGWPQQIPPWEVPLVHMGADSAVALYWNANRSLQPNEKRLVGFAYGLGQVSGSEGAGKLALTVNGTFQPGAELTVTAYVQNPVPNQTLTLELPKDFELVRGQATEPVPTPGAGKAGGNTSTVNWTIRAGSLGNHQLRVRSSTGIAQTQPITIIRGR